MAVSIGRPVSWTTRPSRPTASLLAPRVIAQFRLDDDRPSAGLLDQDIRPPAAFKHVACPFGPHGPAAAEAVEDLSKSDVDGLLMCRIQHRAILTGHRERLGFDCRPTAPRNSQIAQGRCCSAWSNVAVRVISLAS